jgi:hypothetical protein
MQLSMRLFARQGKNGSASSAKAAAFHDAAGNLGMKYFFGYEKHLGTGN